MAESVINGRAFRVQKMVATKALHLQTRLLKAVGPGINQLPLLIGSAGLVAKGKATPEQQAVAMRAAIDAFTAIFMQNESADVARLVIDIVTAAEIAVEGGNGQYAPVSFDRDFTENFEDVPEVALFVLREQFGDFFRALLANSGRDQ